jgi:hypothetical protein
MKAGGVEEMRVWAFGGVGVWARGRAQGEEMKRET